MNIYIKSKKFEDKEIFSDFKCEIPDKKITYISGESGKGKTTLLRIIAGLDKDFIGDIEYEGIISYVFQEPRLFPHLNIKQNLLCIPHYSRLSIDECLATVELSSSSLLYPSELSGGMKIRASIARALYHGGDIYLLDEPFSALDNELSNRIKNRLFDILKGKTIIIVSHNISEAKKYADNIIYIKKRC